MATFALVAGCSHIAGFIAGATSTGARLASSTVEAKSVVSPCAMRASILALAGATTIRSGQRARRIWPMLSSAAQRS